MYDMKALYEASSVQNAIELLQEHPDAKIIAGGSDVLVQMREGRLAGRELVSIYMIDELRGISMEDDGTIRILPLTSFSHITKNPIIQAHINALGQAVDTVGSPQIRNIGTIGGNISNGVTSADSSSTLHAWDAIVEYTGPDGVHRIPIYEFYVGPGKTILKHEELVTAILIRKESYEGYYGKYMKYGMRNALEIATTGCSVNVKLSADKKTVDDLRIGYGVAAPVPIRARKTEALIKGKPVCEETVEEIAQSVLDDVTPRDSWRASKALRLQLCQELARRAFRESVRLSGGEL